MDGGALAGFTSIGVLVLSNIAIVAYQGGKLKQKVDDLCRRIGKLEDAYNNSKKEKS